MSSHMTLTRVLKLFKPPFLHLQEESEGVYLIHGVWTGGDRPQEALGEL